MTLKPCNLVLIFVLTPPAEHCPRVGSNVTVICVTAEYWILFLEVLCSWRDILPSTIDFLMRCFLRHMMGGGCGGGFEFAYHVYEPNGTGERPPFEDVPVASLP